LIVAYGEHVVLDRIDASFAPGRLTAIVGPNGAGKSTLLKAILGLVPCIAGEITMFGEPFRGFHPKVAYVPQRESVDWDFPVSVRDVVTMGTFGRTGWFRRPSQRDERVVQSVIDRLGLDGLEDRQIGRLSGGQQQRVFLARALAQEADAYFMDEPLAGIDAGTERTILDLFEALKKDGKTVVAVHHDLDTVAEAFDDALLLNQVVVASGPVEAALTAETLKLAYGRRVVAE
jgi:manganese/zinc/iron transport system ATP- binding protein